MSLMMTILFGGTHILVIHTCVYKLGALNESLRALSTGHLAQQVEPLSTMLPRLPGEVPPGWKAAVLISEFGQKCYKRAGLDLIDYRLQA